jgi:hypothetical protein
MGCTKPPPQAESNRLRLMTMEKKMIAFAFLIVIIP